MPITLPNRSYQDSVVKILDSITNKIKNNNKLNDYLVEYVRLLINNEISENNTSIISVGEFTEKMTNGSTPRRSNKSF